MRKITLIFVVVLLVAVMAMPAFALGASNTYTDRNSALPFQYFYTQDVGGPYEYPFTTVRRGVNVTGYYVSSAGNVTVSMYNNTDKSVLGSITYSNKTGNEYHLGTFQFKDDILDFDHVSGIELSSAIATTSDAIWEVHFYGTALKASNNTNGAPELVDKDFDAKFSVKQGTCNLGELLAQIRTQFNFSNYQLFSSFSMDVKIRDIELGGENLVLQIYQPASVFDGVRPNLKQYLNAIYSKYKLPPDADVGGFISTTVGGFLTMPIFGEFTFGSLVASIIGLGLVLWFIKLIK